MRKDNARQKVAKQTVLVNDTDDQGTPSVAVPDEEVDFEGFDDEEREMMRIDQEACQHGAGIESESEEEHSLPSP